MSPLFPLSYNANGLRTLPLDKAILAVSEAGYEGIELSLYPVQLDAFTITKQELNRIKHLFDTIETKPICLSTGAANLLSEVDFEPSLISPDAAGRRQRINLLKSALEIADYLEIPVVVFASGRQQPQVTDAAATAMLIAGVNEILQFDSNVIWAIEPEPGMFIQTTKQAIAMIRAIDSDRFMLNTDIGHVQCCEPDLFQSVAEAMPWTRHMHIEDIKGKVHHHEIPGQGDIDFPALFEVLGRNDYRHYLSVELYDHTNVWEEAIHESRRHLLAMMERVERQVAL